MHVCYQQDTYIFWKLRLFFKCFIFRHMRSEYGNLLKMTIFCRSQNCELGLCKHSSLNNLTSTADNFTCTYATNEIVIYSESWDSSLDVLFSGLNAQSTETCLKWWFFVGPKIANYMIKFNLWFKMQTLDKCTWTP